jgi:hypothetical protein
MKTLVSEAEKMLKKSLKKGEIEVVNSPTFDDIFDEVEKEMEDYRIDQNYKQGISKIENEKVYFNPNFSQF